MSFPTAAMGFYRELRQDNTREFWAANKHRYETEVRGPVSELGALLRDEFGGVHVFRPYRNLRFHRDQPPYKVHQGAYVATAPACGWYLEINADEFIAGAGFYHADPGPLARLRALIDTERGGRRLAGLCAGLTATGWQLCGDRVQTAPRGYSQDHPRIELLRHKTLWVAHEVEPGYSGVPAVAGRVAELWREARPLLDWLSPVLAD